MGTQAWKRFGVFARCRTWESFPLFPFRSLPVILLMEENPAPVEVGSLSHYLQSFIHPRWLFGISSINSAFWVGFWGPNNSENVMCFGSPGIDWRTNWKKKLSFFTGTPGFPFKGPSFVSQKFVGVYDMPGVSGGSYLKNTCAIWHMTWRQTEWLQGWYPCGLKQIKRLNGRKNLSVKPSKILITPSPPETMLIKCSTIRDHPSKTWVPKPRSASTWGTPKKYGSNPKQIFGKSPPWTGIFFTTCHQIKQTMQLCKQHAGLTWVSTGFCCPCTCTYALFVLCFFKHFIPSAVPHSENKENLLFKVSSPI